MEESKSYGWLIILLIFIVVLGFITGGNGLFGGRSNGADGHTCGCVSNCEVQKQEIIDNARNLYAIEASANKTIAASNADTQRLYDQSARQYEAGLQKDLFDLKINAQTTAILNNQALQAKDFEISQLKQTYAINERLAGIECSMLKKPDVRGVGVVCEGTLVPSNLVSGT